VGGANRSDLSEKMPWLRNFFFLESSQGVLTVPVNESSLSVCKSVFLLIVVDIVRKLAAETSKSVFCSFQLF
jgi:hypothetical protein